MPKAEEGSRLRRHEGPDGWLVSPCAGKPKARLASYNESELSLETSDAVITFPYTANSHLERRVFPMSSYRRTVSLPLTSPFTSWICLGTEAQLSIAFLLNSPHYLLFYTLPVPGWVSMTSASSTARPAP